MSVRNGLAWMSVAQAGVFLLQFVGSVTVTRLLTPYELGVYAVASALAGMLSIVQTNGLARLIVREAALTPTLTATTQTIYLVTSVALSAAIAILGEAGGPWLGDPGVRSCLLVLAVVPIISVPGFLPAAMLEREGRFRVIALTTMAQVLASVTVTVVLAFAGASYASVAFGSLAGASVQAAGRLIAGRRHVHLRLGLQEWRRVSRYGGQMLAIAGVSDLSNRIADVVVAELLGLAALGLFSRASQLNAMMRDNIQLVIDRVLFVKLAEIKRRGEPLTQAYLTSIDMVTALLWPVFGGLGVLAGPMILLVYGEAWLAAAVPLGLLCLASALQASITMSWEIFVLCNETGRQARFEFIRAGFRLACAAAGCLFGLPGAAGARVVDALFCQALYRPHLERMTQTRRKDFWRLYRRTMSPACAAIAPAVFVMACYGWSPYTPLAPVGASITAGVAGWLLCLRRLRHPLFGELRRSTASVRDRLRQVAAY